MNTIGERLKLLRKTFNISQKDISDETGISRSNISKIESDSLNPTASTIILLSNFFNVSTDWLLTGVGETSKSINKIDYTNDDKNFKSDKSIVMVQAIQTCDIGFDVELDEIKLINKSPNSNFLQQIGRSVRTSIDKILNTDGVNSKEFSHFISDDNILYLSELVQKYRTNPHDKNFKYENNLTILSKEEQKMIKLYRTLSEKDQLKLLGYIDCLISMSGNISSNIELDSFYNATSNENLIAEEKANYG